MYQHHVDTVTTVTSRARSHTRRRLHQPRPQATPEVRDRIGVWKAQVKAARLAGLISEVDPAYANELLTLPSVARGDYSMCSDATMGRRLNVCARTARRRRSRLEAAGLIEVLGHGRDGTSCLVRPLLRDGTAVFGRSGNASNDRHIWPATPDTPDRPPRTHVASDILPSDIHMTERSPPLPPTPAPATGGEENGLSMEDEAEVEIEFLGPEPAWTFAEFWLAMGRRGAEGFARAEWRKLGELDKVAIKRRLQRPGGRGRGIWAGTFLKDRVWEEAEADDPVLSIMATMAAAPAAGHGRDIYNPAGSPELRAWERHYRAQGRSMPTDKHGGWYFPTRLPPLEAPPCP